MDIQSAINRHGTTKAELARKMETSASYITQLVSGQSSPSMKMLDKLAVLIGCKRWEFFIDEMDREEVAQIFGLTAPTAPQLDKLEHHQEEQADDGASQLPFNQPSAVPASLICPHCGVAFVVEVKQK
jgi:transcriptional regulator with XRE-family HTH domain